LNNVYFEKLVSIELSSVQCYRILLLLLIKSYTQSQLSIKLNVKSQNILKYVKELEAANLIEIDRIEGRNKFYKAVKDIH